MSPTTLIFIILGAGIVIAILGRWRRQPPAVDKTFTAKFASGRLGADVDIIAGYGRDKSAPQTFNEFTLRPTLGLRFISIAISCLAIWQLLGADSADLMGPGPQQSAWFKLIIVGLLGYAVIFINTYELRYDNERFLYRNWAFQQKEFLWIDLLSIKDNGHYQYVLRTEQGKRAEVQKYLVGIDKFVAYAQEQIAKNDRY